VSHKVMGAPSLDFETWETTNPNRTPDHKVARCEATTPNRPVILSEAQVAAATGVEGPAFALRYAPSPSTRPQVSARNNNQEAAQ
jgi:hypothetical protein